MPWDIDHPPTVAENWSEEEKKKCVDAANAVMEEGGSEEEAIQACIHAAGRRLVGKIWNRQFPAEGVAGKEGSYTISFSSSEVLDRGLYFEKLSHQPGSVRLDRLNQGGAVLWNHNPDDQRGVVLRAWIEGGKGRAMIRFSPNPSGLELKADIDAGIKRNVSISYLIIKSQSLGLRDGKEIIEATEWEPLEISFVSVPADFSVGVGRSYKDLATMENETIYIDQIRKEEKERVREIRAIGAQFRNIEGMPEMVNAAVDEGISVEGFREMILKKLGDLAEKGLEVRTSGAEIGLSARELKQYNICKAILAQADGKFERGSSLEFEAHEAVMKKFNLVPRRGGFFVPYEVQNFNYLEYLSRRERENYERLSGRRDLTAGAFAGGGALIPENLLVGSFIELLRNNMVMMQLGTQLLSGLAGNVLIPKKTGASTAYWVAEGAAITESQPTLGQIGMTLKTVGAVVDFSWDLLRQASMDVQAFVLQDISETLAIEADRAILDGSGINGQPRGLLNTSGIGSVDGSNLDWADIVEFETDVLAANVRSNNLSFVTRAAVNGLLKTRVKEAGFPMYLNENGLVNGYRVYVTEQCPAATLVFGDWSQGIMGTWGVLELVTENITQLPSRIIRTVGFMAMDYVVRQPVAFSVADGNVS
jgi:HK97 family phage major capsid protein